MNAAPWMRNVTSLLFAPLIALLVWTEPRRRCREKLPKISESRRSREIRQEHLPPNCMISLQDVFVFESIYAPHTLWRFHTKTVWNVSSRSSIYTERFPMRHQYYSVYTMPFSHENISIPFSYENGNYSKKVKVLSRAQWRIRRRLSPFL